MLEHTWDELKTAAVLSVAYSITLGESRKLATAHYKSFQMILSVFMKILRYGMWLTQRTL